MNHEIKNTNKWKKTEFKERSVVRIFKEILPSKIRKGTTSTICLMKIYMDQFSAIVQKYNDC